MFKIETLVYLALVTIGATAWAADTPAGGGILNLPDSRSGCNTFAQEMKTAAGVAANKSAAINIFGPPESVAVEKYRKMVCPSTGPTDDVCREAEQKFNDASGKFSGACKGAGLEDDIPDNNDKLGAIGCSWSVNRCSCLNKNPPDKYRCNEIDKVRGSDRFSISPQSEGAIDIAKANKRMQLCPHADPDDSERYEKQLEKALERQKEAKKKMPELMNKASEAQDKAAEKQNEARRKAADLQKEFAKELSEIRKKKTQDEQQAVAEMAQARGEMDKIDAQIRQYEMSKIDAEVKLGEAKTAIELNCHATASQQVAARQTAKMAAIGKGQPVGDFNKLMNSVGVSSRDAWENVAKVYYKRCVNSRPTRDSKASAQKIYESTVRGIDAAIASAFQQRKRLDENIKTIFTTNGCAPPVAPVAGVPSGESKLCASIRESNEAMMQAQGNAGIQQQMLAQEQQMATQQLATKQNALAMEYAASQQEMGDEAARIKNLRDYLNLKREKSNGVGGKAEAKAMTEAYGVLTAAAKQVVTCVSKEEGGTILADTYEKAFDFLDGIDQKPAALDRGRHRRNGARSNTLGDPASGARTNGPAETENGVTERRRRSTPGLND